MAQLNRRDSSSGTSAEHKSAPALFSISFCPSQNSSLWCGSRLADLDHELVSMPILKPPAISPGAPQQHKQSSRKGKKAWRKNVDVSDVQEGLELVRGEVIQGYALYSINQKITPLIHDPGE